MTRGPYKSATRPGTVGDLIRRFQDSPRYARWSESTRADRDRFLAAMMAKNASRPLASVKRGDIQAMYDKLADRPGLARNWLSTMRSMFALGVKYDMIASNPATHIETVAPVHREGFRAWREDEIAAFLEHHKAGTTPHLALTLMLYTAAGRADAVRLGSGNLRGGRLVYERVKTGAPVNIPVLPPLAEALAMVPPRMVWLVTWKGTPWHPQSLTGAMRAWAGAAGLGAPDELGRTLGTHGLRKACGIRLSDAGCTPQEIADWLGDTVAQAMTYVRARDKAASTDRAAERLGHVGTTNVVRLKRKAHEE